MPLTPEQVSDARQVIADVWDDDNDYGRLSDAWEAWQERAEQLAALLEQSLTEPDTVTITCEVRTDYATHGRTDLFTPRTVTLPSWCSGDPATAAALYLFGHASYAADIRNARVED